MKIAAAFIVFSGHCSQKSKVDLFDILMNTLCVIFNDILPKKPDIAFCLYPLACEVNQQQLQQQSLIYQVLLNLGRDPRMDFPWFVKSEISLTFL